jgi:hypothetical protein
VEAVEGAAVRDVAMMRDLSRALDPAVFGRDIGSISIPGCPT